MQIVEKKKGNQIYKNKDKISTNPQWQILDQITGSEPPSATFPFTTESLPLSEMSVRHLQMSRKWQKGLSVISHNEEHVSTHSKHPLLCESCLLWPKYCFLNRCQTAVSRLPTHPTYIHTLCVTHGLPCHLWSERTRFYVSRRSPQSIILIQWQLAQLMSNIGRVRHGIASHRDF